MKNLENYCHWFSVKNLQFINQANERRKINPLATARCWMSVIIKMETTKLHEFFLIERIFRLRVSHSLIDFSTLHLIYFFECAWPKHKHYCSMGYFYWSKAFTKLFLKCFKEFSWVFMAEILRALLKMALMEWKFLKVGFLPFENF